MVASHIPPRPSELTVGIPPMIDDLATQLLEKDPAKQPNIAMIVMKTIREALVSLKSHA